MKKSLYILLGLLVFSFSIQACGSSGQSRTPPPEKTGITSESAQSGDSAVSDSSTNSADSIPSETSVPKIIFFNGTILTMEENQPQVEALALAGDIILAVGAEEALLSLAVEDTQMIDLKGATLLPGFIDSHAHWIGDNQQSAYSSVDETIQYLVKNGWTSINEMFVTQERLNYLIQLDQEDRLPLRVNAYLPVNYLDQRFGKPYLDYTPLEILSPHVRVAGVKFFTDNDWGHIINWEQGELNAMMADVHQAGWQIAVHTFMTQGHDMVLEALDYALQGEDNQKYRHRIEHVIEITDEQLAEIQQQGYLASIQLNFPGNIPQADPTFYDKVSPESYPQLTRWEDLYQSNIILAGGTDWPWFTNDSFHEKGAPAGTPLRLIYKAATHADAQDQVPDPWMQGQLLLVDVSIKSLTINGAYATFEEDLKGSLASGKWADLVILSRNPLTVPVEDLVDIEVLMTMIGGDVVYCAQGAEGICGKSQTSPSETTENTETASVIEIAVQGPVTGPLADYYAILLNVAEMAAENHGALLGEVPVKFIEVDDRCEASLAADAAASLLTDYPQVSGVIGPFCSTAALESIPVYQQSGLVAISGTVTEESLSGLAAGVFFRTYFSEGTLAESGITEADVNNMSDVQAFYDRYQEYYDEPLPDDIQLLMAYSYDAVRLLLNALENTVKLSENGSLLLNRSALADALRTTRDFPGITGSISFNEQGDRVP